MKKLFKIKRKILIIFSGLIAMILGLNSCAGNKNFEKEDDLVLRPLYGVPFYMNLQSTKIFDDKLTEIYIIRRHKR